MGNVSQKEISDIIKNFEKIEKLPHEMKRPKHERIESYLNLAREIEKCMMISDKLNWYDYGGYTKMTALYSNVNITNESKSKRSIVNEKLSQSCSTDDNESKRSIFNKPFLQNCLAKENKLCSTTKSQSECPNDKQKTIP